MSKAMHPMFEPSSAEERRALAELEALIDYYLAEDSDGSSLLDFPEWLEERRPDLAARFVVKALGSVYRRKG